MKPFDIHIMKKERICNTFEGKLLEDVYKRQACARGYSFFIIGQRFFPLLNSYFSYKVLLFKEYYVILHSHTKKSFNLLDGKRSGSYTPLCLR